MNKKVENFMAIIKAKNPGEVEFHQAVQEAVQSLIPYIEENPKYQYAKILERMTEPERIIIFRVPWINDKGEVEINRGYRVQMNSAIGPYKGGIRFHPTVNLSTLKFLAFEQTLKNSLTSLPMGGGKGGSDFDPIDKSDNEVMRFCQSFMTELFRHISVDCDIPAGDIGVGSREIGYMYGQYKRIKNEFTGVFTGKGIEWGGSLIRPEATGFGGVYFVQHMLSLKGVDIQNKTVAVSGFGNVAWGAALKATQVGAKVIALSGPDGVVHCPQGMNYEKINYMLELRATNHNVVAPFADKFPDTTFIPGKKSWSIKCDIALPCAFQNELNGEDAKMLLNNGTICVAELSNMGCTAEAVDIFTDAKIMFAPGKAVNAGGVATSGLEITQNSIRLSWSVEEVDIKLKSIMKNIHDTCVKYGTDLSGYINYVKGANIGGFVKIANAMMAQGYV